MYIYIYICTNNSYNDDSCTIYNDNNCNDDSYENMFLLQTLGICVGGLEGLVDP